MTSSSENPVTQKHNGSGDNVAGSKYVSNGPTSDNLAGPISKILESIRHRLFDDARTQLDALSKTSSVDHETKLLFEALNVLTSNSNRQLPQSNKENLIELSKTPKSHLYADIANSILMRLDCQQSNADLARKRFEQFHQNGKYSREVFFELVADKDELRNQIQFESFHLAEAELCGIFRGCLRLNERDFSLEVANYLVGNFDSFNSNVFLLIATENNLFEKISAPHYWYTTATEKKAILSLCDEVTELLDQCKGSDFRLVGIASRLLLFTLGNAHSLDDVCQKFISTIREIAPEFGDLLIKTRNTDFTQFPEDSLQYKLLRGKSDSTYRTKICSEAKSDAEASFGNAIILRHYGSPNDMEKFIENSNNSSDSDGFEQHFIRGLLEAAAIKIEVESFHEDLPFITEFIAKFKSKLGSINVESLKWLCERLLRLNRSPLACEILENLIPKIDLWISPLTNLYLYSLMHSKQLMTLETLMGNIGEESRNVDFWKILSHHYETQSRYDDAIDAIRKAISFEPSELTLRSHLINLLELNETDEILISQELNSIPENAFATSTNQGFWLISRMLQRNVEKGEELLIDWFLADPETCATPITNIFLGALIQRSDEQPYEFVFSTEQCERALTYSSNGDQKTALITNNQVRRPNFVSASSPLGELLLAAEVGIDYELGMNDIRVVEILPPVVAAFRISLEIRDNAQDGTDVFYKLTLPEDDPDAMLAMLERKLPKANKYDEIFANPQIPIFMKGHFYRSTNPVFAAITQLSQKKSAKPICPNFGESSPSKIILDIYAITHIFLSGLDIGLLRMEVGLVISKETKECITSWLANINRPDYLTIGANPDGGLWRTTAEDIQRETHRLQEFLKALLDECDIVSPKLVDLPPDLTTLTNVIDQSVLTSIQIAIANDLHWLCIDSLFINLTSKLGYSVVNVNDFYRNIIAQMSVSERKHGFITSVACELPVQLTFHDLVEMARSHDDDLRWVLPELMMTNSRGMQAPTDLIYFLNQIIYAAIVAVNDETWIQDGIRELNPTHKGHVERIFNACCFNAITAENSLTAEARLAPLLKELLARFSGRPNIRNLISMLANRFIDGYFLNRQEIMRIWED